LGQLFEIKTMNTDTHTDAPVTGSVILLFGPQSVSTLAKTASLAGEDAVMDSDVSRMAGASFAFGQARALEALLMKLKANALQEAEDKHPSLPVSAQLWLANGERGVSSNTIFSHLTGVNALDSASRSHPHDPADVRRCQLLLEQVPQLQAQFHRMAEVSETWARLVQAWPSIIQAMDEDVPNWRDKRATGSAHRAYELVQKARGVKP